MKRLVGGFILWISVCLLSVAPARSQKTLVPRLMKFSGTLHDALGKPLGGSVDVTFSLYNTEAGGDAL